AFTLLRRRSKTLAHDPNGDQSVEQAKRIVVMSLAAQNKYDHIFTTDGLEASLRAFDNYQKYARLLADYPDPLKTLPGGLQFNLIAGFNSLEIEQVGTGLRLNAMPQVHPINPTDDFIMIRVLACAHAQITFMYQWCMDLAGTRPRNYQDVYIDRPVRLGTEEVKNFLQPFQGNLSYHSEFFPPVLYFTARSLIVAPDTALPFNITIPY
ncbi:MAG: hypothetical protein KKD13_04495, partial [Candidatus Margulisbacteria bacterium]|nr:hypothetical protein [Candidatus Margulisiibacteriota bacterium]